MNAADETPTPELLRPAQREVFISYARADVDAARRLNEKLTDARRSTWIDLGGIEPTEEWLAAIYAGIDRSDNFLLLITPRSVGSPWCGKEVDAAAARNKRLIPVLIEPTDPAALPPLMAARQWIDCATDFDAGVTDLLEALDRDIASVHEHTRLLGRAIDWKNGRGGLLARGELAVAEQWLSNARKEPAPTPLHTELIVASRRAVTRTLWQIVIAAAVAVIVALALAVAAFLQRNEAQRQTVAATRNLADAMAARAVVASKPREALRGVVAAVDTAVTPATRDALLRVLQRTDKLRVILDPAETAAHLQGLAFDAAGTQLAALRYQDEIQVWDLRTGVSRMIQGTRSVEAQPLAVYENMVALGTDVWRGKEHQPFFALPEGTAPSALALTADRIAVAGNETIEICGFDAKPCLSVTARNIQFLAFAGAGAPWLAAGSANQLDILDGKTLRRVRSIPLPSRLVAMGGSAPRPLVTVVLSDATVCTVDVTSDSMECTEENETPQPTVARTFGASSIADAQLAVTAGQRLLAVTDYQEGIGYTNVDPSVAVWDASRVKGQLLPLRRVITGYVKAASPDGSYVVLLDAQGHVTRMHAATGQPAGQTFTPAGTVVGCSNDVIAAAAGALTLHDASTGGVTARLALPQHARIEFSPDGRLLAVAGESGVRFYALPAGAPLGKELPIGNRVFAFVPGRRAIVASDRTSIEEWNIDTAARTPWKLDAGKQTGWDDDDAEPQVFAVSPDGRRLATNGGGYAEGMTPRLVLWDLERGSVIASQPFTENGRIESIDFGKEMIVTADDSILRLFDAATLVPIGDAIALDESHDIRAGCTAHVFADGSHAGAVCNDAAFTYSMDIRDWRRVALRRASR